MTIDEARKAMIAFLDQFIGRGAASDVIALRDRLRDKPESMQEISSQLPDLEATPAEVFGAMRRILEVEPFVNDRTQPNVVELHSWTEQDAEGRTSDPAQWEDWLGAVATIAGTPKVP